MVIKTYLKTLWRMFKKHVTRLLSIIFMVLVSVGFVSGIGTATDKIDYSLADYYVDRNVSDFIVRSTTENTFPEEELKTYLDCKEYNSGFQLDVQVGEKRSVRLYFLDFDNWTINLPDIVEGDKSTGKNEIYCERSDNVILGKKVGEEVDLSTYLSGILPSFALSMFDLKTKVAAVVQSPLTFSVDGEPSDYAEIDAIPETTSATKDMDVLEQIFYIPEDILSNPLSGAPLLPHNVLFGAIADRDLFACFSESYNKFTYEKANNLTIDGVKVLTLSENYSFRSLNAYGQKVKAIGYVLMAAFMLVTALVVLSTMTRLLEEERSQIACLKTLGYSSTGIISKYLFFALIGTGIGGAGGYFVALGLAHLLYFVFNYSFAMPPISPKIAVLFYILIFALIVVATLAATAIAGYKLTNERPASLLRPKPPRAGKKVLLEKIPFIWNRVSFKYKSTLRNVLRYKSRFIMTVVSVALSTALVLAGLSLLDMCLFQDFGSPSIMGIAAVIVVFAGVLTAVVIYTLTNINISERNREIATLMVLGYRNNEVTGYIYREVAINSAVGIVFGYPAAVLLITLVFDAMGMGMLSGISWFTWLIAPFIVMGFTGLIMLALRCRALRRRRA